jgi:23S rRNA pseudouridine1911/1915/1917 synthase
MKEEKSLLLNNCELCIYAPESKTQSIKEYLQEAFDVSGNLLKKHFKKPFLESKAIHQKFLAIPFDITNKEMVSPVYEGEKIEIIHECDKFLVFNKPHDIHGHPLSYDERDNCLAFLRSIGKGSLLSVNSKEHERGLLYRLDFVTSGVLIYVKKEELYQELRSTFLMSGKEKKYLALVHGNFNKDGAHELYFSGSGHKGHRVIARKDLCEGWQKGVMFAKKVKGNKDFSLVEIELKSGLRHQIRATLAHFGFPIFGDELYGGDSAERVFLHAKRYCLEIHDVDYAFEAPMPSLFSRYLD